jgi:beta-glucosidase
MSHLISKFKIITIVAIGFFGPVYTNAQLNPSIEKRIDDLLKTMSLEEKIGQMAQVTLDVLGKSAPEKSFQINDSILNDVIVKYKVGSVLNTSDNKAMSLPQWHSMVEKIQQAALSNRLKIPVIYGFDAIHGATYVAGATLFPQQIGLGATWNKAIVSRAAQINAYESKATSVHWNFSPVLDLGSNPLWPRLWETFGEDPYLVSAMGVATIKGYQGQKLGDQQILGCLKHFLAYSDPKFGKDRTNAWIPEHYLREYHLPSFRAAIDAGARTVMVNSALINGVPTHMNGYLLNDLLKKELKFSGLVVTDWQDIDNLFKRDNVALDRKEAIMFAINAGIDMAMIPYDYQIFCNTLKELVREKKVTEARINDAVKRILRVKFEAGVFSNPVNNYQKYPDFGSAAFEAAAYDAAAESITLLKNENGILPLSTNKKILVTGPNANSMRTLNGGWTYSWQGEKTEIFATKYSTILKAMEAKFGSAQISFVQGVAYKMQGKYYEDSVVDLTAVQQAAAQADCILLCLGENSYTEKPGDLNDLNLSPNQILLAQTAIASGKPVILVLNEGRPRIISNLEKQMAAIVQTYLPGNFGGVALADVLYGKVNPSGKLPYSYPRYVNALTGYLHKYSDEQVNPQGAYDYSADYNPQYDFGFGLSYTSFSYTDLVVNDNLNPTDTLRVSVKVKNTGLRAGKEVVELFVSDQVASLAPDVRRLRGFEKVELQPGEEQRVNFSIPIRELAFVNLKNQSVVEKGKFTVAVEQLKKVFSVKANQVF